MIFLTLYLSPSFLDCKKSLLISWVNTDTGFSTCNIGYVTSFIFQEKKTYKLASLKAGTHTHTHIQTLQIQLCNTIKAFKELFSQESVTSGKFYLLNKSRIGNVVQQFFNQLPKVLHPIQGIAQYILTHFSTIKSIHSNRSLYYLTGGIF